MVTELIGGASKASCRMIGAKARAACTEKFLAQRAWCITQLVAAAPLQFGHDEIDKIEKGLRCHCISEIEPVHIGFLDPGDQFVRYLRWRADHQGPRPPIAACFAISRTVHTRSGSEIVNASSAEVCAFWRLWRIGSSGPNFEKSTPVQPDIRTSAPSSETWDR